ncbi:MAG: NADH-quinone oxidoreductase subunit J [Planctomycetes bacterium]|nr:NADH-quinone oxidoreductase subunit J [Planctomycetota bacterium]
MSELLFYAMAVIALLGGLGVIFSKSPMGSVLSLLGSFFALAVIYLLAGFHFMAAVQILVYAGAIMVLFLFVIMLLNLGGMGTRFELSAAPLTRARSQIAAAVAAGVGLAGLIAVQRASLPRIAQGGAPERIDDINQIAIALFGRYSLPFQAVSVLLLTTMVAVLVLAKRRTRESGQ